MKLPSYIPEIADKKYRQQTFLQSCLTSPPHLRRRTPAPRAPHAPTTKPATLVLPPPPPPPPLMQETRMGTRSRSPSTATRISQIDGTCDIDFSEEEGSNNIARDEKVIEIEGMRDEKQLVERLQLRDSLRKRRIELLDELSELETRTLELCQTREVQRENRNRMLRQQKETEAKI